MFSQLADLLVKLVDATGLFGIFIATCIESFFAPIPSEIVLFTAGYYANSHGGVPVLIVMCVVASLGNYVGTLPFYLISRFGAESFLPRFLDKWGKILLLSNKDLKSAQKFFEKRGSVTVFLARLIPGIRSLIAFPAGVSKMNFFKYTFFTLLGSFIWNVFLGMIGYLAFDQREMFFKVFDPFSNVILGVLGLLVTVYILRVVYLAKRMNYTEV